MDFGKDLLNHFEQLEAGVTITAGEARTNLAVSQYARVDPPGNLEVELRSLPSIVDIEIQCLRQKPGKAAGPDGLPPDLVHHVAPVLAPAFHSLTVDRYWKVVSLMPSKAVA